VIRRLRSAERREDRTRLRHRRSRVCEDVQAIRPVARPRGRTNLDQRGAADRIRARTARAGRGRDEVPRV